MKFAVQFYAILSFLVLLCAASCQKKDSIAPVVTINQPSLGTVYSVYDTVFVQVTVFDETQLVSVSAKLVDANFIPIAAVSPVQISSQSNTGYTELVIDDKLVETGEYYVLVIATDGTNEQREFREIRINGLPKERLAVYFTSKTSLGDDIVFRTDSLLQNTSLWIQPNQDIKKLCVNSLSDKLTVIGNRSVGIKNYDLSSSTLLWSDEVFSVAQTERYSDLYCYKNEVITSIYDREVRAYNSIGGLTMNLQTGIYRPETIHAFGDYLLVEMNLVGDNDHFIFVYHAFTHSFLWQLDVPMDIVSICELRNDELLLFGNESGNAKVLHYDVGSNAYWEPRQLPSGKVIDASQMENEKFVIAHENGLYAYTYSPNYLNLIGSGRVYQQVLFDEGRNTILGASSSTLEELSPTGQLLNSVIHSDSITSFDIHYTR